MKSQQPPIIHPSTIAYWVNKSFEFAAALLWPSDRFDLYDIHIAKTHIAKYYIAIPAQQFNELIGIKFQTFKWLAVFHYWQHPGNKIASPRILFAPYNPESILYNPQEIFCCFQFQPVCLN